MNANSAEEKRAIPDYTLPLSKYDSLTFGDCVVKWIWDSIWSGKIKLSDVPKPIRLFSDSIYMSAFRIDRYTTPEKYLEDIHIMLSDYSDYPDALEHNYSTIILRLSSVEDMENGKEAVRNFWKNLEPELKEKLRAAREYGEAGIRTLLADKLLEEFDQ